jgi:hypothetical protein
MQRFTLRRFLLARPSLVALTVFGSCAASSACATGQNVAPESDGTPVTAEKSGNSATSSAAPSSAVPITHVGFTDGGAPSESSEFPSSNPTPITTTPSQDVDGGVPAQSDAALPPAVPIPSAPGLAAELFIDGSVHTGTDWSGEPYVGVWGEPFEYRTADYPMSWAFGLVHASMLLRSEGIPYSPNAVLSIAIKESRLGLSPSGQTYCSRTPAAPTDPFPNGDGCFQIEDGTAYAELRNMFPERFAATHDQVVGDDHFASAALAAAHYQLFSVAMLRLESPDPAAFFAAHPTPARAELETLSAAYNRGLWWDALPNIFSNCTTADVTTCFGGMQIAVDYANSIADYARALDAVPAFDGPITLNDLNAYWASISVLYPNTSGDVVKGAFTRAWNAENSAHGSVHFAASAEPLLAALNAVLPPHATVREATTAACGLGYLYGAMCTN